MVKQLWQDESGVVVSAELVLVLTITVLAMVVGLHAVSKSVAQELNDVSSAIGALDQSYSYDGFSKKSKCGEHSKFAGSGFKDRRDDCDCEIIVQTKPKVKVDNGNGHEAN
jgi:Flp pilus assembly pilin Flp